MSGIVDYFFGTWWFIACLDRYLPYLPYMGTFNFTIYGMVNLNSPKTNPFFENIGAFSTPLQKNDDSQCSFLRRCPKCL